jgi:hypothetical protein
LNPRLQEVQLEDQNPRKAQEDHLEEGEIAKPTRGTKNGKLKKKQRKVPNQKLPLNQTLPTTLNASSPLR